MTLRNLSSGRRPLLDLDPLEDRFQRHPEHPRNTEGGLEGGGVFVGFDGGDGLAGHADIQSQFALSHLMVLEPQTSDIVTALEGLAAF